MDPTDLMSPEDIVLAEELPQQVRVAEGRGAQGEWVVWVGGNRKTVHLIALDNDAFYGTPWPLDRALKHIQRLRDGETPSVVLDAARVVRLGKIMDVRVDEITGRIRFAFLAISGPAVWSQKGFSKAVQRDLLEELAERIPVGKRWHRAYSPIRAAMYPLFCIFMTAGMTLFCWALAGGLFDSEPKSGSGRNQWVEDLAKATGPTGVILIGVAVIIGQCVWLVRSVRNPPIMAGIKPKATFWRMSKKLRTE